MDESQLSALDWVTVTDLIDDVSVDMEVIDYMVYEEQSYLLVTLLADEEDEVENEDEAFIFKVCQEDEADMVVSQSYTDTFLYVNTDLTEEEFQTVAQRFENSNEYDLEVEDNDDDNE